MKKTFAFSRSTILSFCRVNKIEIQTDRPFCCLTSVSSDNCNRSLNKTSSIPLRSSSPAYLLKKTVSSQINCLSIASVFSTRQSISNMGDADTSSKVLTQQSPVVVCVEGNIGCGKTTLLNYFQNEQGCEVLAEPVEKWRNVKGHNALALMYKDPVRWSMTLQTYIQLTMVQNHARPQVEPIKLMERSIYSAKYCFTDNLLQSGKMTEFDHVILTEWFDWIIETQDVKVDLIVYLRTNPEVLYSRILERCRPEEKSISLEYLTTLHQLHEDWLIHKKKPCPAEVLVIEANSSMDEMVLAYERHKGQILLKN